MAWLGIPSPLFQLKIKAEDEIPGPVQNAALQPQQQEIPPDQGQIKRRRRRVPSAEEAADKASSSYSAGKRSSIYRGVTRHRWTGRYEAHLWDKGSWNHSQNKRGKQVYLGAYDEEEAAARAYDLAALKYWGPKSVLNFPVSEYVKDLQDMQLVSKEEYLASLRRKSSGFSRGVSKYRGVARHHHNGRWEARIGRVFGNKYLYLGTYSTQEEAAAAYDMAAIEYRGLNAVTNFDLSRYTRWLRPNQLQLLLEQQQQQQQEQHHQQQLLLQQQQQEQEQHQQQQQNFNHLARQQEQQQQQQQGYSHSQLQEQHAWSRIPMLQHMSPAHQHPFLALACGSGSDDKDDNDNPNYAQNLRTQMQASMMLEVINTPYCLSRMHNVNASYDEDENTQGFLSLGHGHAFGSSSSNPIVLP